MNLFILSEDPREAAQMLCDKHVPKMMLETAQLMCTLVPQEKSPYKHTHKNHPCAKWLTESYHNVYWLAEYGAWLHEEYKLRFGKEHKSYGVLEDIWAQSHRSYNTNIIATQMSPFKLCMPDKYKTKSAVDSYRRYYAAEKSRFAEWKRGRKMPTWYEKLTIAETTQ